MWQATLDPTNNLSIPESGNFLLVNLESCQLWSPEYSSKTQESHYRFEFGIQVSLTKNLKSTAWNPESKNPLYGAKHCTHTCGDEHSATLYYIQTVVSNALIQAKVFAVDDSKLQSIGLDTYSVIISEFFSILQPGDAGFWLTRHLARHDVTRR